MQKLPENKQIIAPTLTLVKRIDTASSYHEYKTRLGWLDRGLLIQVANPSLSLKQAQNRGNRVYAALEGDLVAKAEEALKKGWIDKLSKKRVQRKYEKRKLSDLIQYTCNEYCTQADIAKYECQLRTYLENTQISKVDVGNISAEFHHLMTRQSKEMFTGWEVINLYWAVYTGNKNYIALDGDIYESTNECMFANYLFLSEIPFEKHCSLVFSNRIPDFKLADFNVYIEVLMCDPNDKRACARTPKREAYSVRALKKMKEFADANLQVEYINGDVSGEQFYEKTKSLINEFYPDLVPPKFELVRQYNKENLAYLLEMTEAEINQLIDDAGGTAKFRNNKYPEYKFLINNREHFSKLWGDAKQRWQDRRIKNAVKTKLANSRSVSDHIDAIRKSNLSNGITVEPWGKCLQSLYNAWGSHYAEYRDIFEKLGIFEPPVWFKLTFFKNAGKDNKNLKVSEFIKK